MKINKMKTIKTKKLWILALTAVVFLMTGCKKDFDVPQPEVPAFTLPAGATLKTIADFKITTTGVVTDDVYICGIVGGNDISGNIYKYLYIQDSTGGMGIEIDKVNMFNIYPVGQRVYVKCQGLHLGFEKGMPNLGGYYNGAVIPIPEIFVNDRIFRDGLPGPAPAAILHTTTNLTDEHLGMLVRFDSVSFNAAGQIFNDDDAYKETLNRIITDGAGDVTVRVSWYADFHRETIPSGKGTVYGILTKYNSTWQLLIRDFNDLQGFDFATNAIFTEPFESGMGGFTTYDSLGTQAWAFSSSYGMVITGYESGSRYANKDYLISPAIDLSQYDSVYLAFDHAINYYYGSNIQGCHSVWLTTNFNASNPSATTWVNLSVPTYPAGNSWTFVNSGKAYIPAAFNGATNVRFAFKYTSTGSSNETSTWEVKNVVLMGKQN